MTPTPVDPSRDPAHPRESAPISITLDGREVIGRSGQTVAGMILAAGIQQWRRTSVDAAPRGVFCGIGVCFDCLVTINGLRDVRACLRRARDGDVVVAQHDRLPKAADQHPDPS